MMSHSEDPLVIPLWLNGRAYLTMVPAFLDVRNPHSGLILRRTPLCGSREAMKAVESAQAAIAPWIALTTTERSALLASVGKSLADYADHFAGLIAEETGSEIAAAHTEVAAAIALLHDALAGEAVEMSGVVGVVGGVASPLLQPMLLAVPALMAGATVVVRPSPEAPSALFALAELTGRCGVPAGVFNILQGGEAAVDGLRITAISSLLFS